MSDDSLTPGQRLVRARWNLRTVAERWVSEPEPSAGSNEARRLYGDLTDAARELATAQDAFDLSCAPVTPLSTDTPEGKR